MADDDEDARLNRETDARTNQKVEPLPLPSPDLDGLTALREAWALMPMIPRLVMRREEGVDNSWPGFDLRTLLIGEESGGRFTFHDVIIAPGEALPPHHLDVDSHLVVLDGELTLTVGERTEVTRQDGFAFAPDRVTLALANRSAEPVRFFLWHSPAGPERAFAAAHAVWLKTPDAPAGAYREALASLGFVFHRPNERLENDGRVNIAVERIEAEVTTFADYAQLRNAWAARPRTGKIVHDRSKMPDIPMVGQDTKVLVSGDDGAGSVIMHYATVPGFRAEEHHQPSEEEIFLVLEGVLNLTAGNITADVPRGGFGFVPRYGTHGFGNPMAEGRVRTITLNSPPGHERGFEMIVRESKDGGPSERMSDLLVAYGWRVHDTAAGARG